MSLIYWFALFSTGCIGVLLRYLTITNFSNPIWGTFAVNIVGSLLIGLVYSADLSDNIKLVISVGFLGALTTYSSFSLDILKLIQGGALSTALFYFFSTNIVCITACWIGIKLSSTLHIFQ